MVEPGSIMNIIWYNVENPIADPCLGMKSPCMIILRLPMIFPCSSDSRPLTDGNIVEDHVELTVNDWNLTNHRGYETRFETNRFKGIKYDFTKKSVSWKYLKIGRALHPRVNHCVRSIKSVAFGRHVPQFQIRSYGHMVMLILMITIWSPSDHHRRDPTDCQHYHQAKQSGFPEDANIGKTCYFVKMSGLIQ